MAYKYTYTDNKTKETFRLRELEEKYQSNFVTYTEFADWLDENYTENCEYILSPYERQRNAVYATGNKWAIENWNATHN